MVPGVTGSYGTWWKWCHDLLDMAVETPGFEGRQSASGGLAELILGWGASLVGFADLRGVAPPAFSHLPSGVSIVMALDSAALAGVRDGPTMEYYEEYKRANRALDEIAARSADHINSLGHTAEVFPATIVDSSMGSDYQKTLSVGFQHKTAATRAGLGWIGKSALLVTPEFGSRVRLVTVFTDMPLHVATHITEGRCGDCRACSRTCPAGAIKGREWRVDLPRAELVDVVACRAKMTQLLLERVGVEDAVCGVCLAVCPVGVR